MGVEKTKPNRIVIANSYIKGYPYNEIKNTKYTILTFLPKNLFQRFYLLINFLLFSQIYIILNINELNSTSYFY
jgi:hypothetical protein